MRLRLRELREAALSAVHRQARRGIAVAGDALGGAGHVLHLLALDEPRDPLAIGEVHEPQRHGDEYEARGVDVPRHRGEQADRHVAEPLQRADAQAAEEDRPERLAADERDDERDGARVHEEGRAGRGRAEQPGLGLVGQRRRVGEPPDQLGGGEGERDLADVEHELGR